MKMTAQMLADKTLLNTVNDYLNQRVAWQLIASKGTTNRLYRGQISNQSLILRANAGEDWAFGVSRETEAQILELIQGCVWAPKVVKNNWREGWCLMWDHGDTIAPPINKKTTSQLLMAISEWQLIQPRNIQPFDYSALFNRYQKHIDAATDHSTQQQQQLDQIINRINKLPAVPQCLTHHDLHIDNICSNDSNVVILDWEYAGFGNPLFDGAALFKKFKFTAIEISTLPAFSQINRTELKQAFAEVSVVATLLEKLWLSIRGQP